MTSLWIDVDKREEKRRKKEEVEGGSQWVLTLAPFVATPRLSFGRVLVGTTKSITLAIRNPHEQSRRVVLHKMPKEEFEVDRSNFTVDYGRDQLVSITWNPQKAGNRREILGFFVEHNFCPHVVLIGEAHVRERRSKSVRGRSILRSSNVAFQICPIKTSSKDEKTSTLTVPKENVYFGNVASLPETPDRRQTFLVYGSKRNHVEKTRQSFVSLPLPSVDLFETCCKNTKAATESALESIDACSDVSLSNFAESVFKRRCSTVNKNKPLPEFDPNVTPVEPRKRLFPTPKKTLDQLTFVKSRCSAIAEEFISSSLSNPILELPTVFVSSPKNDSQETFAEKYLVSTEYYNEYLAYVNTTYFAVCLPSDYRHYLRMREAAVLFQTSFRKWIARKKYTKYRRSALTIQRFCRSWLNTERRQYLKMKRAAIAMQRMRRGLVERRIFLGKRFAAVKVQLWWRSWTVARKQRALYAEMKVSCVRIQAAVRCWIATRSYKRLRAKRNESASIIQRYYRRRLETRSSRKWFLETRSSVILIRATWMSFVQQRERNDAAMKNRSCIVIQAAFRGYLCRKWLAHKHKAARIIQGSWRAVRCNRRLHRLRCVVTEASFNAAATVIQAAWRGYVVRCRRFSKKFTKVRANLLVANAVATPEEQLGHRTRSSLQQLETVTKIPSVLKAVKNLETTTSMSSASCMQLAQSNALDTIVKAIQNCNRSRPSRDIVKHCIGILINVAKCHSSLVSVWNAKDLLQTILKVAVASHEKAKPLFTKCCSLIWILALDEDRRRVLMENGALMARLADVRSAVHRKHDLSIQRQRNRSRAGDVPSTFHNLSSLQLQRAPDKYPDWMLGRNHGREFTDHIDAIDQVARELRIESRK